MEQKYGVLLAGGTGSRLAPMNQYVSKHLLPVNNKPIIDYPLNTLKQMGITDLMVIVGSKHSGQIIDYLGSGKDWEMDINFKVSMFIMLFAINIKNLGLGMSLTVHP